MGLEIESRICSETAIENRSKGEFSISGIIVMDMQGIKKTCKVRALLDSGAGTNFVAAEVLNYVKYEKIATETLTIQGINTVERKEHDLVRLFIENDKCRIKEIKCYVMVDLGKAGYLIDRNKMNQVMEEYQGLEGLQNPLDQIVDHQGDIGIVLTSAMIKDISLGPQMWYAQYTVDRTYFGPAVSGRIPENTGQRVDARLTMINKVEVENMLLLNEMYNEEELEKKLDLYKDLEFLSDRLDLGVKNQEMHKDDELCLEEFKKGISYDKIN